MASYPHRYLLHLFFSKHGCRNKIFSLKINSERDIEFCITLSWLCWSQCYSKFVSVRIHRQEEGTTLLILELFNEYQGRWPKTLKIIKAAVAILLTFPIRYGISFQNYALFFRSLFWSLTIQIPFNCMIFFVPSAPKQYHWREMLQLDRFISVTWNTTITCF